VLGRIQLVYQVERESKALSHNNEQRAALRQIKSLPILKALGQWMEDQSSSKPYRQGPGL